MYDSIVFPVDDSEGVDAAFEYVIEIAETHDATLHLLTVADVTRDSVMLVGGQVVDILEAAGEEVLADAEARGAGHDIDIVTAVRRGTVARTIVEYTDTVGADMVVMPTRGQSGVSRTVLGSVTARVLRQARTPVLTLNPDAAVGRPYPPREILVAVDGGEASHPAQETAIALAADQSAVLHILTVLRQADIDLAEEVPAQLDTEELRARAEQTVAQTTDVAADRGVEVAAGTVETGAAIHEVINEYTQAHGIDLIVMGTHGRTGVQRHLLGSVAEKTVRTASVPVMTVRSEDGTA